MTDMKLAEASITESKESPLKFTLDSRGSALPQGLNVFMKEKHELGTRHKIHIAPFTKVS